MTVIGAVVGMARETCVHDPLISTLLVAAHAGIFIAYMALPAIITWILLRIPRVPFPAVWILFAGFILCCGLSHLVELIVFFRPAWYLLAVVCLVTAVVSLVTALLLSRWRFLIVQSFTDFEDLRCKLRAATEVHNEHT